MTSGRDMTCPAPLDQGWAIALPGAPFEYVALERFAQSNKRGFWGFQADTIRRFR